MKLAMHTASFQLFASYFSLNLDARYDSISLMWKICGMLSLEHMFSKKYIVLQISSDLRMTFLQNNGLCVASKTSKFKTFFVNSLHSKNSDEFWRIKRAIFSPYWLKKAFIGPLSAEQSILFDNSNMVLTITVFLAKY